MARQSSNKPQCGRTLTLTSLLHRGTGEVSTGDAHTQVPVTSRQVTQLGDMLTGCRGAAEGTLVAFLPQQEEASACAGWGRAHV